MQFLSANKSGRNTTAQLQLHRIQFISLYTSKPQKGNSPRETEVESMLYERGNNQSDAKTNYYNYSQTAATTSVTKSQEKEKHITSTTANFEEKELSTLVQCCNIADIRLFRNDEKMSTAPIYEADKCFINYVSESQFLQSQRNLTRSRIFKKFAS